ncbi:MAG: 3-dehydroquinate synthase [Actinomycetales bacterium]|nr:MAG: 3-dehydroquinate synthase [Actinomycetales bacterium]
MKSISIKAEREYSVNFDRKWRDVIVEIAKAHEKTLVVAPVELIALLKMDTNFEELKSKIQIVSTPSGEAAKSPEFLLKMWEICGDFGLTRSDCIVGIGGGATTDLAGFVAATWLRGITWHAIPTSLAGMVDAAIGGKTGINSEHGKNLIGSFYSPGSVTIDESLLQSLPARDFNAGMAEVIKAGFIADPVILDLADDAKKNISELIWRSIDVKAGVVSADFKESRLREILNYGHTLGHAIEKLESYKLRHGEAVSIGLVFAAELSNLLGKVGSEVVVRHRELLQKYELPISYKSGEFPKLLDLMSSDKKARGANLRFIGLEGVAKPIWLENVTGDELADAYERISL